MSSKRQLVTEEKFYTVPDVACALVKELMEQLPSKPTRVIEPSAGAGAFSSLFDGCIALDTNPEGDGIQRADFFVHDLSYRPGTLVVGNPPFGRQASLALKFLKRSCTLADHVAFILPISFQKESMLGRVPLTHSLLYERVLRPDAFIRPDGRSCFIRTVWQVWERRERKRVRRKPRHLTFVKTPGEADFAVRRVGMRAGDVFDDPFSVSPSSHYFLKGDLALRECIRSIDWTHIASRTTGPRSLSRMELDDGVHDVAQGRLPGCSDTA